MTGTKYDSGKSRLDLIPPLSWLAIIDKDPHQDTLAHLLRWRLTADPQCLVRAAQSIGEHMAAAGLALAHGAKVHGEWNWREVPQATDRYYAAALRHALCLGELDPDTGLPHEAHLMCNILFLLEFSGKS